MKTPAPSLILLAAICTLSTPAAAGPWSVKKGENPDGPGAAVDILHQGRPAARLVHGEGQMKPFLHVFGVDGELLTNPGIDAEGKEAGRFPHHRGIFIGWNQIRSELGSDDLWHFRRDERMEVTDVRETTVTNEHAEIVADIVWRSSKKDEGGDDALIHETRTLRISKPENPDMIVVDATFTLTAARDLTLGGDLQHAGVHFRAHRDVVDRANETIYMWAPEADPSGGRIVNADMRWCRLIYPIGERWYSTIQINAPGNLTEELSWRDYGRFGFFFKHEMKKGESVTLHHRFITSTVVAPREDGYDEAVANLIRERSDAAYEGYASDF